MTNLGKHISAHDVFMHYLFRFRGGGSAVSEQDMRLFFLWIGVWNFQSGDDSKRIIIHLEHSFCLLTKQNVFRFSFSFPIIYWKSQEKER